jgi:hypothetical protein
VDKDEFLRRAPGYYAAAVAYALESAFYPYTRERLSERLGGEDILRNDYLFDAAIRLLERMTVIVVEKDDFAPSLYGKSDRFPEWWESAATSDLPMIRKIQGMVFREDQLSYLTNGLRSVNESAGTFWLTADDFKQEAPDMWEPIPIDRGDPAFGEAQAALDRAIDEIEGSNGYAAAAPEERNFVVAQLARLRDTLKTEVQVQWMMVKTFGLDPLALVIKRFGTAAAGVAALAASQAINDWLKKVASRLIEWFTSL